MNKTKTIYFLSAFVLIIGCYALNLSYSLFTQTITPENNTVDATVPYLSASLETSSFTIPANDSKVITLKIINSGTSDINYGIFVSDTKGTTIQLVETYNITGKLAASTTEGETTSKEVLVYVTNPTDNEIADLTFNLTTKYTTIAFDEDTFINSSNIDCVNTIKLLNNTLIARAKSITESDSKTNGYAMYSDTLRTTPAEEVNEADESLLLTTEDDYGTSYYYRGNVKDNYVNFAGMCWRIVRTVGDGSTKLILEDQYTTCDDTETETTSTVYTGNWNIGTGNYGYDSSSKSTSGSILYKMSYLKPVSNNTSSMIKAFYDFQTTNLTEYTDKLKSGNWCLGDTAYKSSNVDLITETPLTSNEINTKYLAEETFYYDAYIRLTNGNTSGYQPILKCNGTILDKFASVTGVSSEVPMYVNAITIDEILYVGGKDSSINENYYLINNYQKSNIEWFWALSPSYFSSTYDHTFIVYDNGKVSGGSVVSYHGAFRPAINLTKNIIIEKSGDGTQTNPYVIK